MKIDTRTFAALIGAAAIALSAAAFYATTATPALAATAFSEQTCVAMGTAENSLPTPAKTCACLAAEAAKDPALDAELAKLQATKKEERPAYSTAVTDAIGRCSK